jgi:hypothetical protein
MGAKIALRKNISIKLKQQKFNFFRSIKVCTKSGNMKQDIPNTSHLLQTKGVGCVDLGILKAPLGMQNGVYLNPRRAG